MFKLNVTTWDYFFKRRNAFWRILRLLHKLVQATMADKKLQERVMDRFCCHWSEQYDGIFDEFEQ